MSVIVYSLAFIVLWWVMSVAMFIGALAVFDRDEAATFIHEVWRLLHL